MSVLIKHMAMPKGCIYANEKDQTEYCPLLNHDDVPFCQYIENEPEAAIGIDERPVYCPLYDVPKPCEDAVSRRDAIDAHCELCADKATCNCDICPDVEVFYLLPSAQPEREKGEWIPVHPLQSDDCGAYMCSKCKTRMWEIRPSVYHYCPNCGADMRGKNNGKTT